MHEMEITKVHAREVLDSRGNPTVEASVTVCNQYTASAIVPSGASTGKFEAVELRDAMLKQQDSVTDDTRVVWGKRYGGKGVLHAVKNVNTEISECLLGKNGLNQPLIDEMMIKLDGTENKSRLGANAILAVSMANARACAKALGLPLYRYLGGTNAKILPTPMMNILNGGVHAKNTIDFQEFMIMPVGADSFSDALRMGTEVYHSLKKILAKDGKATAVGDEGGFAPDLKDAFEVFDYLERAVGAAGYECGKDIVFAMDAAASELHEDNSGMYYFPGESEVLKRERGIDPANTKEGIYAGTEDTKRLGVIRTTEEMITLYEQLCNRYPIRSIEDGLDEEDWDGWKELTRRLGNRVQLVGDDLFVTNEKRLKQGITLGAANAILVKVNQIGTLTEAFNAVECAHRAGYRAVISHRSGESEDSTIADIAVALNAGQIKTGAPCRSDRVVKYNRLLRIEEDLSGMAFYRSPFI
ncbi:MAG: phosphopyruvate hydratase [Lachnospiraceae bacterium]|nr:phosphopyruvate hydratase [Roseburia sp.]MBP3468716.1 phosphopyruvate hydratase [Lachnospiraceae bacterium]